MTSANWIFRINQTCHGTVGTVVTIVTITRVVFNRTEKIFSLQIFPNWDVKAAAKLMAAYG